MKGAGAAKTYDASVLNVDDRCRIGGKHYGCSCIQNPLHQCSIDNELFEAVKIAADYTNIEWKDRRKILKALKHAREFLNVSK